MKGLRGSWGTGESGLAMGTGKKADKRKGSSGKRGLPKKGGSSVGKVLSWVKKKRGEKSALFGAHRGFIRGGT